MAESPTSSSGSLAEWRGGQLETAVAESLAGDHCTIQMGEKTARFNTKRHPRYRTGRDLLLVR